MAASDVYPSRHRQNNLRRTKDISMSQKIRNHIDGILLIDKPQDWTSHDVVNFVRRRFKLSKTGHCGTLDPFATGLLVLLLGKATKLQDQLMSQDKTYTGCIRFGSETDSEDRTGKITANSDTSHLKAEDITAAAARFVGPQTQTPPMVSALKVDGQPLYKLARQGKTIERAPRPIIIHSFDLLDIRLEEAEADFVVRCSKGTYIRTLAADLGRALGCGAHLQELRRLESGSLNVEQASSIEDIKAWELTELMDNIMPINQTGAAQHSSSSSPIIVTLPKELAAYKSKFAFAFGVFDGVHLGHQEILRQLKSLAKEQNALPATIYFQPPPKTLLSPEQTAKMLYPLSEKQSLFAQYGILHQVCFNFTRELAQLSPQDFLERYLFSTPLELAGFCVGENWRFGARGAGNATLLKEIAEARGLRVSIVSSLQMNAAPVSSTRIRQAIQQGDFAEAALLLGRPWRICGKIEPGLGIAGPSFQCPTANLSDPGLLLPPWGIYAARATLQNRPQTLDGIVYIGDAPTIRSSDEAKIIVEMHLFDFNENLYGQKIRIEPLSFLRQSQKFPDQESLKAQIQQDMAQAKDILKRK
jgi:tRNA pseudouridine(55) synthase/riboflavin kinase/FMN adenylyltransferase